MSKQESETSAESVQLSFGTLFRVKELGRLTNRVDVVIETSEGDWFEAFRTRKDHGKYELTGFPGTGGPEDFGKIVGQLNRDEVMVAAQKWAHSMGIELDGELQTQFNNNADKPAMILHLG